MSKPSTVEEFHAAIATIVNWHEKQAEFADRSIAACTLPESKAFMEGVKATSLNAAAALRINLLPDPS